MKIFVISRRILLIALVGAGASIASSCDLTKDESSTEEHCTSDQRKYIYYALTYYEYQSTYYCFKEGDYVKLRYVSSTASNVCTSKYISVDGGAVLLTNQPKFVQVIARLWFGTQENNTIDIPLYQSVNNERYIYSSVKSNEVPKFDISGYFPSGGSATIHFTLEFKFISSGDNVADQNYFKSVFNGWNFSIYYYPY